LAAKAFRSRAPVAWAQVGRNGCSFKPAASFPGPRPVAAGFRRTQPEFRRTIAGSTALLMRHSAAKRWTFRALNEHLNGGSMIGVSRAATWLGCAFVLSASSLAASPLPRPAPNCPLALPQGHSSIGGLAGKVVYVDFWASWCVSCLASFPFMEQLQRELGSKGLQVVAVNLDQKPADAQRFLASHRVTFPIALGANDSCAKQFGVGAMPSTFFVDRSGKIRAVHSGFRPGEGPAIRGLVEKLLAEPRRS